MEGIIPYQEFVLAGLVSGRLAQVRPPHIADEKGVAGKDSIVLAFMCQHNADTVRRMAGGVQGPQCDLAEMQLVSIVKSLEGVAGAYQAVRMSVATATGS